MSYRQYQTYSRRTPRRRRDTRSSSKGGLMPFLLVISFGVMMVLLVNLVIIWFDQQQTTIVHKIVANVEQGSATLIPWGKQERQRLYDGTVLLPGDRVQVADNSRLLMRLFDGGVVRFGDAALFELLENDNGVLTLKLETGRARFFAGEDAAPDAPKIASLTMITPNMAVKSMGRDFDIARIDTTDAVRVYDAEVDTTITDSFKGKTLQQLAVGVGQEIVLSEAKLNSLRDGSRVSLIKAINERYKQSEWYSLNQTSDPRTSEPVIPEETPAATADATPEASAAPSVENTPVPQNSAAPKITSHQSPLTTAEEKITLTGTVPDNTLKVQVKHFAGGIEQSSFFLRKYLPGSGTWKYVAVLGEDSNLFPGKNVYEVYAYDDQDNVSPKASIEITHTATPFAKPTSTAESTTTEEPSASPDSSESPAATPKPSKLESPAVSTFNASAPFETTEDLVKITGTVDPSSIRVFVNGFALTGYRSGEPTWTYYAAKKYNTLQEGENTYRVYSVDAEGNRSNILEFIVKKVQPTPEPTEGIDKSS